MSKEAITDKSIENGFVILKDKTKLLKVNGSWFKIDFGNEIKSYFSKIIGPDLLNDLLELYELYIRKLPTIETFDEGMKISKPLTIFIDMS